MNSIYAILCVALSVSAKGQEPGGIPPGMNPDLMTFIPLPSLSVSQITLPTIKPSVNPTNGITITVQPPTVTNPVTTVSKTAQLTTAASTGSATSTPNAAVDGQQDLICHYCGNDSPPEVSIAIVPSTK
ncbi:hypothetical protein BC833DRAFT_568712 [Globomyces pollinis-pini]|nr:hypothetical protein BC833DRAFT_568712 [Globomyces pollinis-pini]